MNLSSFCIKHRVSTILAFILISVFGLVFYTQLKLALLPNIEYPAAYVMCVYSGASPEDIEELVTRPLESAVATVSGVDSLQSQSSENVSVVMITYNEGTDVDSAANKLREKFAALDLPDGCNDPVIVNMDMNAMMPVVALAVTGENLSQLQDTADDVVGPALERIEGVASVSTYGGTTAQITVAVDTARISGYNISIDYLSNMLAAANILYPGGDVNNGSQKLTVTTDGQYKSLSDVADTLIPLPAGGVVRLSEVADVYWEESLQDSAAKFNSEDCIVLFVNKRSGANEVETANDVKKAMEQVQAEYPDLVLATVYDASEYIHSTAANAVQNIVLGVVLAAVVVFLFLRRFGATLTIAISMPFSILTVFVVMNIFDLTMNMMSLGGIAMGVGMIVDNSIVVLENIYRYAGDGYNREDACVLGTKEVTLAVLASTLTTVAVFVPIGLSGGLAGMMFKDFCLTIAFLLLASLLVSLTLVPLLCYFLLDESKVRKRRLSHDEKAPPLAGLIVRMRDGYLAVLRFFLRRRFVAMLLSLVLVVVFIGSCASTKMILIPNMDQGQITISVSTPTGTELEQSAAYSDRIMAIVEANCPELDSMYYNASGESSTVAVMLVPSDERERSSEEVANALRTACQDIAGCEITVSAYSMTAMASSGGDIYVELSGDDMDELTRMAQELSAQIAALPDAIDVSSSVDTTIPAVKVTVNRQAAAQYGLTTAAIGGAVRSELTGATATSITLAGADVDVVIKGNDATAESLDALRSLPLTTGAGGSVPLSAVATVTVELTPQTITRIDQSRQVTISGDTVSGDVTAMSQQVQAILDGYQLPDGYTATQGGTYTDMMESFGDLLLAMLVALCLIYFILASQFNSFVMPVIVMLILPVAFTGALFGLPLTGNDLSMVSIIGLIMLAGVVVNASIILVDYINVRRAQGYSKNDAILAACPLRIRPIMMTTLTTVLAMLPMAIGIGEGAELMRPMGIVMMSGMIIATAITLFFTPVYYSVLDSLAMTVTAPFRHRREKIEAASQAVDEVATAVTQDPAAGMPTPEGGDIPETAPDQTAPKAKRGLKFWKSRKGKKKDPSSQDEPSSQDTPGDTSASPQEPSSEEEKTPK